MNEIAPEPSSAAGTVTIVLRGYLGRDLPTGTRSVTLPLAQAPTPRAVATRLSVQISAVGLVLVNKQQAGMDTPLHAGDVVDILPLMGGG
jgi:hypothetical protein